MSTQQEHTCDNCGDNPIKDECYCKICKEDAENEAYERGKKDGLEEAKNNQ